jgi:hypothetical protein
MGYRQDGWLDWVGWVGGWQYDEAAVDSLGRICREGKLALGLADRHRSRLEATEVTSRVLKMEQMREAPIGDRRSGTTFLHGQWSATHQFNSLALQATGPGVPDDRERERVRVGSHEPCSRISRRNALGRQSGSLAALVDRFLSDDATSRRMGPREGKGR